MSAPRRSEGLSLTVALAFIVLSAPQAHSQEHAPPPPVDATTLKGKVLAGYQGWFRCPGDPTNLGWVHWSKDSKRLTPETLAVEMWPDLSEFPQSERFPAAGFTYPDGRTAELFSSDNAATVERHFEWMQHYGIDGVWLQHFAVDLPGGPLEVRFPSRQRVLSHVRAASEKTGRVWAVSYDIAGMPASKIVEVVTREWKRLVDTKVTADPHYLHHGDRPVVQVWGFYWNNNANHMTAEVANQLIDFFRAPGPYSAYFVGGGDWDWRKTPDPAWQAFFRRFDAYTPWNVGNYSREKSGVKHAATSIWADDKRECDSRGVLWIPVVYPGFSWDNLKKQPPGTTTIARSGGRFLWEQFHEIGKLGVDSVYVAMFDEVDEGTAIFKVTNHPPVQSHFRDYDGYPSDWYLRLVGEGSRMIHGQRPLTRVIPIHP